MFNENSNYQEIEWLAFQYSELAYIEASKPESERSQWVVDLHLCRAKALTNLLINNGFWKESVTK